MSVMNNLIKHVNQLSTNTETRKAIMDIVNLIEEFSSKVTLSADQAFVEIETVEVTAKVLLLSF